MNNWFLKSKPPISASELESNWEDYLNIILPGSIEKMINTAQSPVYHAEGNVWIHTKMVVEEVMNTIAYQNGTDTEKYILIMSALLHDIAKPFTTTIDSNNNIIAPNHSKKGAIEARNVLWGMGIPIDIREMICSLIYYHQTPFFAFNSRDNQTSEFLARKISLDCSLKLLTALSEADMRGRVAKDKNKVLDDIELFAELSRELDCFDKPYNFPDSFTASRYILSHGKFHADTPIHKPDFEVILLSGLPATGKDYWSDNQNLKVISYDKVRKEMNLKHGKNTGMIVHKVTDLAKELLAKKESFIWNATHLSQNMRNPALNLIRSYNAEVKIIYFETTKEELLKRNESRESSLTNDKLIEMARNWELPFSWESDSFDMKIFYPTPRLKY